MKIGITGITGLIGKRVAALARSRGHEIAGFTRHPGKYLPGVADVRLFTTEQPPDVSGCDAILNLSGESIIGIWTAKKRRAIRESRILGTRRIVEAIAAASPAPRVLVNGSAVGYYGDQGDAELTEHSAPGPAFLCQDWEAEALKAPPSVRTVLLRTGIVLARASGALPVMLPIFRLGLGGQLGSGRQWMPWIHLEDEAALALLALENEHLSGPLNATAPAPARNADFTRQLAHALHRPAPFTVPAFALRTLLGGFSDELLESHRVLPAAAAAAGFRFQYPTLGTAFADLL